MRIAAIFPAVILICCGLSSCGDFLSNLESKPRALGKTNEVVVIADDDVWNSSVQDTVDYYFGAPYPVMPQPEPIFDLRRFSIEDLQTETLRKELRTYLVLANLADTNSLTTKMTKADLGEERLRRAREDSGFFSSVGREKWASGQLLIYVFGYGNAALAENVIKAYPSVAKRIYQHDLEQIDAATYINRESLQLGTRIREKFGVSMKIPGDYQVALDDKDILWLRQDLEDAISNVMITRFSYGNTNQLEKQGIIHMLDSIGRRVEGSTEGSVMRTNAEDLPVLLYQKEIDGHYVVEARGIWELTDDFLGGPFISYAIVNGNEIILVNTFVFAPGEVKRNYMQRLEHIVNSLKFLT